MKVLLVNGSPHSKGSTNAALIEVAGALEKNGIDTEIFHIGEQAIVGCIACRSCAKTGRCYVSDPVNVFLSRVETVDGIVVGSPVHFASATGMLTAFLDRSFYLKTKFFADKPAAAIVVCRRGGATSTFEQINKYFAISNMPVVSSQYWNMVHGNTPEEINEDPEGLQTLRTLGVNMAWLLKCIEAGKRAGFSSPQREEAIKTNFVR
ncbi:MAG: flavodoxin family protein [Deferribacteraceae bacterium]|jgi:multimeric flavodoxin WrbA|nr:flavodoxin family protein [Deferribacteraceae bacterium]